MTEWVAKRFWTDVAIVRTEDGFQLSLDGRSVKTPGRRVLTLPSRAMAAAAAAEWSAQTQTIDPTKMPVTRSANSAIDQTAPQRDAVIDMLAAYGETDLLCHRADRPDALVARQEAAWAPLLHWVAKRHQAQLNVTTGILPTEQPAASLSRLHAAIASYGNFGLTALHDLIQLSGSVVIGLAVAEGEVESDTAWELSRIDEDWQIEQWGPDEEAAMRVKTRYDAFSHAAKFVQWSGTA
ncbi:MAG: ATP12 family protein [Pseudomonadota bacterium]